jgi:hypothetical protein
MSSLTLVVIVLTSVGAFVVATRGVGLRGGALPGAIMRALDCLGLAVFFLLGNLGLGLALVLGLRAMTGQFLSVYMLNDATLAVLSVLQALVLHCWQARSR